MKFKTRAVLKRALKAKPMLNIIKVYTSYGFSLLVKSPIVWGMPPLLMVEPTNVCNLMCPLCLSGNGSLKRSRGYIELSLYYKLIDEIKDTVLAVFFWNQGEPFLHKDILTMFRYAKEQGLYTITSTNANVFPDHDDLVKSGLGTVVISLDGATQESYNKYRVNGDFHKVLANTEALIQAKRRNHSMTPIIEWQFLIMKHNEHEVEIIKDLAVEMGVDNLVYKTVQIYNESDIEEFLPSDSRLSRYRKINDGFTLKKKLLNRCRRIFTQPVINWDGELSICCYDKDNVCTVGNLETSSLSELWKGKQLNRWRKVILTDRKRIEICRNCGEGVKLAIKK